MTDKHLADLVQDCVGTAQVFFRTHEHCLPLIWHATEPLYECTNCLLIQLLVLTSLSTSHSSYIYTWALQVFHCSFLPCFTSSEDIRGSVAQDPLHEDMLSILRIWVWIERQAIDKNVCLVKYVNPFYSFLSKIPKTCSQQLRDWKKQRWREIQSKRKGVSGRNLENKKENERERERKKLLIWETF